MLGLLGSPFGPTTVVKFLPIKGRGQLDDNNDDDCDEDESNEDENYVPRPQNRPSRPNRPNYRPYGQQQRPSYRPYEQKPMTNYRTNSRQDW